MQSDAPLTHARILRFYYPLALSWLFMSIESPISIALISRLPAPVEHTATFLVLMGLALWIESPIIDLLATSTTLCRDRQSFAVISKFVLWLMVWCTVVHAFIALTPLFDFIAGRLLSVPTAVREHLRTPLALMIPWSACIGWRRYRQGLLIRSGRTRAVGFGTAVRMGTMAVVGVCLYLTKRLTGTELAAISLIASVFAEALFAHFVSRQAVRELPENEGLDLEMGKLLRFHLPLTATTMLTLATIPIVSAAVAKSQGPVLQMAAWQVTSTLLWMHRTVVFALPEVIITLYRDQASIAKLRSFCLLVGAAATGFMGLLWLTRLDVAFFLGVLGAAPQSAETAHFALGLCILFPFIGALQSYARGMLTVHHLTMPRLFAVAAGMAFLLFGLWVGLRLDWPGVALAAFAMTIGLIAEWVVLTAANVRSLAASS